MAAALPEGEPGHLVWKRTTVDGRTALYGVAGEGTPVLFLHGWGLGQHSYKRALKRLVRMGNQMAIVGTVFLAAAIVLALYVITDVLFTTQLAILTAVAGLAVFVGLWYVVPLLGHTGSDDDDQPQPQPQDGRQPQEASRGASSRR